MRSLQREFRESVVSLCQDDDFLGELTSPAARIRNLGELVSGELQRMRGPVGCPTRVSVVVPVFNENRALPVLLASIAANAEPCWREGIAAEVVVVDNGSTDGTGEMANRFGARVVVNPEKGVRGSRHMGLLAADGEFVVCTDADTFVGPEWIAGIVETFDKRPDLGAIFGGGDYVDEVGEYDLRIYNFVRLCLHDLMSSVSPRLSVGQGWNLAVRRAEAIELGGFMRSDLSVFEDATMARAFALQGRFARIYDRRIAVVTSGRRIVDQGGMLRVGLVKVLGDLGESVIGSDQSWVNNRFYRVDIRG